MVKWVLETTDEWIGSNGGLVFAAKILNAPKFRDKIEAISNYCKNGFTDYQITKVMIALLTIGKNSFEDIDIFKNDSYFKKVLELKRLPSKERLRQRINNQKKLIEECIKEYNVELLKQSASLETVLDTGMIPVDFDATPFDNSNSKKEGVSYTYKGHDGFAPMMTYIGGTGFMLNNEFREGKAHSNCEGTGLYIKETVEYAREITNEPILCRFDSGNDSAENVIILSEFGEKVKYLIKRNLRRASKDKFINIAKREDGIIKTPRKGKTIYYNSKIVELIEHNEKNGEIKSTNCRLVVKFTERKTDKHGQMLLVEEKEIEAWHTNLDEEYDEIDIIEMYKDHGTSEQFHSEFKTDMNMERLPSGKFETNSRIITMGLLAFNILRLIGQETLNSGELKRKRKIKRPRLRKVLQDIMYMAFKYITKFKRPTLQFNIENPFQRAFLYAFNKL